MLQAALNCHLLQDTAMSPFQSPWCSCFKWKCFFASLLIGILSQPTAKVFAQTTTPSPQTSSITNQATARYESSGTVADVVSNSIQVGVGRPSLIDPAGVLLGCDGQLLASYAGFSMALYEPGGGGLDIGSLVALTPTQGTNSIPPNRDNLNPFGLEVSQGRYNFLLDAEALLTSPANAGLKQTSTGAQYILVINPPEYTAFNERRVKIEILGTANDVLSYRATALDGQPIGLDGLTEITRTVEVRNAAAQNLVFVELGLRTALCESNQIRLTKSADRAAALPGDAVLYRLSIQNLATADVDSTVATDTLPVGFDLILESVSGQIDGRAVAISTRQSGAVVSFSVAEAIAPNQTLEIIYAARLTPEARRGSGRNSAIVTAERADNDFRLQAGPSTHQLALDPGLLSDCGTLIGRVFEDKNFDGEQQTGEAGIPNAVIFLDDGNRVVTDADGLFSVQKMLPGQRTGTLDLSALPGYTLAPNLYFNERNSDSRLVNLAPGGLVRMNFAVTPTFQEEPVSDGL